ncbi:MAG: S-ribosylhomocysteine lyase [Clostridia bacterium]|nr:S-ribosylhomocysteine lyase [Clostridia bacterium]
MDKIASFTVNHLDLLPGLYVSRRDERDHVAVTTFDLRLTAPNREPVMDTPAIHTIEHLGATYLRNSARKDDIVYFGPMGCRTGFYLLMFGILESADVLPLVRDMCQFILDFEGEIPGAKPEECGNYSEQNLNMAKYYVRRYLSELTSAPRTVYPEARS